jgi:hypothetical protein
LVNPPIILLRSGGRQGQLEEPHQHARMR